MGIVPTQTQGSSKGSSGRISFFTEEKKNAPKNPYKVGESGDSASLQAAPQQLRTSRA